MRWDSANDPLAADETFATGIAALPIEGATELSPWPGWLWPAAADSINARWAEGQPSAGEKVALAFGLPGFAAAVSNAYGVLAYGWLPAIPDWWGIDHGWAAASLLEPAPASPVQHGGQIFEVADIEALLSVIYASFISVKVVGRRSHEAVPAADLRGRPLDPMARDIDPGAFHVLLANRVGLRRQGVVVDRQLGGEVWNQPVRSFAITNAIDDQLLEITESMAVRALGLDVAIQVVLGPTPLAQDEQRFGSFTALVDGDYVVGTSGTGDVDLYVKLGAPATEADADRSGRNADSFERCRIHATAGTTIHWAVIGYGAASTAQVWIGVPTGAPAHYTPNADAARFFLVEMDLRTITNARPSSARRAPDQYTRTDQLRYVLETDQAGTILGGEWIGQSARSHPDFAWWPLGRAEGRQFAGLGYAAIRAMALESAG